MGVGDRTDAYGSGTEPLDRFGRGRRHLLIVFGVGVLFALTAIIASTALAAPEGAKAGKLTPEQRERFVQGAKEVAGLSEGEIARALRNPDDLAAIPISVEDTLEPGSSRPQSEGRATRADLGYCTYLRGTRSYVNVRKEKLFSVTGTKRWCFDYYAVTSAPPARLTYAVTEKGREEGWQFVRLVQRAEGYRAYAGLSRGSHASTLTARFRTCSTGTKCTNIYPQYMAIGRYDGTGGHAIRTLSAPPAS